MDSNHFPFDHQDHVSRPHRHTTRLIAAHALLLALPALASGQGARVPAATVARVISAEFAYCQRAENADATQLATLTTEIQNALAQQQRAVDRLMADSAAASTALKNAQAKFDEIDGRLSPLQVERNGVRNQIAPLEEEIARLERGSASAGAPGEHAELVAKEAGLRAQIANLLAEIAKLRKMQQGGDGGIIHRGDDVQGFFQGMTADEGPVGYLRQAEKDLAAVMERLRAIRRETHPIRFGAEYQALQRKLADLDRRVGELEGQLDAARKARDDAKTARDRFDNAGLALAREENLYLYEHLTRAQHCIEKRRQQLNQAASPVATTTAGTFTGKYGVFCRFADPDYGEMTDSGTVTLTLNGSGGVNGTYAGGNGSYGVGGSISADGTVGGTGSGSGWTVGWSGRLGQERGGAVGNGSVTVNITSYGGGTCTGTWSIP